MKPGDASQRLSKYCRKCCKIKKQHIVRGKRHVNITSRGYSLVIGMKGHPLANKSGQIYEHWLILYEQHQMGGDQVVWFKKNRFTVHHKNGVRADNRLENLEFMAPGKHGCGWSVEEMREVIRRHDLQAKEGE